MEDEKTFDNLTNEGLSKPGDEYEVAAVLTGMTSFSPKSRIQPDLSNLGQFINKGYYLGRKIKADVLAAINSFFKNPKELTDDFASPPLDLHPDLSSSWDEKQVTDYVNEMKRKGFSFYGSITDRSGTTLTVLSKKRATLNTLQINKELNPKDFWNDFYANYEGQWRSEESKLQWWIVLLLIAIAAGLYFITIKK